jgi:hypothetical protein
MADACSARGSGPRVERSAENTVRAAEQTFQRSCQDAEGGVRLVSAVDLATFGTPHRSLAAAEFLAAFRVA